MALPSSGDISLQAIIAEIFGIFSANNFQTCITASLLTDKTLPIGFKPQFQGYVDDISFTSSPASLSFTHTPSGSQNVTIVVDSPQCHVGANPAAWITAVDSNAQPLVTDHVLYSGANYVLTVSVAQNNPGNPARSADIVIHLTTALGNAYQTRSGTTLNITINQDAGPSNPYLAGFTLGNNEPNMTAPTSTSCTGLSVGSTTIYPVFTPNGTFTAGNHEIHVIGNAGATLYSSTVYMAAGYETSTSCSLSRGLYSGEGVIIVVGDDNA